MAEDDENRDPKTHRTPSQKRRDTAKRQKLPKEVKKNSARRAARRAMEKAGRVKKGDGKEVNHKTPLSRGGSNKRSNLQVTTPAKNRSHRLSGKSSRRRK